MLIGACETDGECRFCTYHSSWRRKGAWERKKQVTRRKMSKWVHLKPTQLAIVCSGRGKDKHIQDRCQKKTASNEGSGFITATATAEQPVLSTATWAYICVSRFHTWTIFHLYSVFSVLSIYCPLASGWQHVKPIMIINGACIVPFWTINAPALSGWVFSEFEMDTGYEVLSKCFRMTALLRKPRLWMLFLPVYHAGSFLAEFGGRRHILGLYGTHSPLHAQTSSSKPLHRWRSKRTVQHLRASVAKRCTAHPGYLASPEVCMNSVITRWRCGVQIVLKPCRKDSLVWIEPLQ